MIWLAENRGEGAREVRAAWVDETLSGREAGRPALVGASRALDAGDRDPWDPVAWTPKNPRLARLAEEVRRLSARGARGERCATGLAALDAALGGGLALGALHELVAEQEGSPAHSLALSVAARLAGRNRWIVYLDTSQDFYPPGAVQLGVPLGRLLVVRTPSTREALFICEQTLRCRAVAATVLPLRSVDAYTSRRLQLAAEAGGSLGLLIRRELRDGHTFAATRLRIEPLVGTGGARQMQVWILKTRTGRPVGPVVVDWPHASGFVPAHAVFFDRAGAARRSADGA